MQGNTDPGTPRSRIVLGIGSSHTPMLNAALDDWPRFVELDRLRPHRDKSGRPVTYDQLLAIAGDGPARELAPELLARRHAGAMAQVEHVGAVLRGAKLDALVIVGDDQKELFFTDVQPSVLVYHGATIRNAPLKDRPGPRWAFEASRRFYEPEVPRDYPVHQALAQHLVAELVRDEFDIVSSDTLPEGPGRMLGEGHAFGFVHRRLLQGADLPVVPIFLNTYYPPNQPTPRRCWRLGEAILRAIERHPGGLRVGVIASGGLSHFTVDEELDGRVLQALRERDAEALCALPTAQLESGSSEIRNWICMAGATQHLPLQHLAYIPGYRTPAGTGTGLAFGIWSAEAVPPEATGA
ncbi:MAG: protocatechuate 3,4-dioxygenase [Rubrivivax sp.]|nr:protocatechuate 3,4-dioxygenase [Rubrivivax sp.]